MWLKYPLVRLAVPFVLGISVMSGTIGWCNWRLDMLFVVMCCLLMMALVCHTAFRSRKLFRQFFSVSFFALVFCFGASLYIIRYRSVANAVDLHQTSYQGIVSDLPQAKRRTAAVQLALHGGANLLIYLQNDSTHSPYFLQKGDTLTVQPLHTNSTCPLTLSDTSVFYNYTANLFYRGIPATCYVPSDRWIHAQPQQRDTTWNELLHQYYHQSELDTATVSMVEALTIGRREGLSTRLRADYSAAGVAHLLALSGMHLALIIGLLNWLIFKHLLYEKRRWAMLCVIPLIWVFAYVAGFPPSLLRATVMATFLQIGFALQRQNSVLNSLSLAAIIMLCVNPLMLHNVGFQLSFLSMIGIAVVFRPMYLSISPSAKSTMPFILYMMRLVRHFITLIMMTVSTTLFTAPVVAWHFGQLPVYSLLSNLVVPFILTGLMVVAALWLLTGWWPDVQTMAGHLLDAAVALQNSVVQTVASLPASVIHFRPDVFFLVLYYLFLVAVLVFLHHKNGRKFSPQ